MTKWSAMFAVLGPGAVGGLIAALVKRNTDEDVVAVARPASAEAINARGITINSTRLGRWTEMVPARTTVPSGANVVIAVKGYGLPSVLDDLRAARPAEALSLLNGVEHMAPIRAAVAPAEAIAGSIRVEARRASATEIEHLSPFARVFVPESAAGAATVEILRSAGIQITTEPTEADVLWHKFQFLGPHGLLGAYWNAPLGEALVADPVMTAALFDEFARVATAEGVPTAGEDIDATLRSLPSSMRTSFQDDVLAGGPTELENLGGAVLRLAATHDVAVPTTQRMVDAIRERYPNASAPR